MPWFRTRVLFHKLPPIPIYKTVDTKALASKYFLFNSNKLDYISNFLGHGKKLRTDFDLWRRIVIDKCEKSLNYMCKYCGVDVRRLEAVWTDFKPFVKPATHAGVFAGRDKWTCPHCASEHVKKNLTRYTAAGTRQHQMRCHECHSTYSISDKAHCEYQEAKKKAA